MRNPRPPRTDRDAWLGHVPLLFADLCDYTALGERADPEDVALVLARLEQLSSETVQRHGGNILQVYGDGLLIAFGLTAPSEHAARQALDAALELRDRARSVDWSDITPPDFHVALHIGVHSGLVLIRAGDALHGRFELTGDTVSTTSRLCAAAARDQILASDAVLRGLESYYRLGAETRLLALKGKSTPVAVTEVVGHAYPRTRSLARRRHGTSAFVGRHHELSRLRAAVERSRMGQMQLVVVRGVGGIGKSRLLEEWSAELARSGARCFVGSCQVYPEMPPLEPFRQVAEQALLGEDANATHVDARALRPHLEQLGLRPTTATTLLALLGGPQASGRPADVTEAIADAVLELLGVLRLATPVVLLLDDWQWADDGSRKVLASLARDAQECSLCVVVSQRDDEDAPPLPFATDTLILEPLDERDATHIVRTLRPREFDPRVASALHQQSGGNPLFLEELCRCLPDEPLDAYQLEQQGTPTTLHGVIQARLARLPEPELRVLRSAAVIGVEFSVELLARLVAHDDLPCLLERLAQHDLIYRADGGLTYRFKHGITREVVYGSMLKVDRRREHGAIAHAIVQMTDPHLLESQAEALAYHFRASGNHERAVEFAELAGYKALATSALDRAQFHLRGALEALSQLPPCTEHKRRWLHISTRWTNACVYGPATDQVRFLVRAAAYADELGETGAQAQTRYSLGWIHYVLGNYQESIAHYEAALALASAADATRLMEQLWANLGQSYAASGRYDEAFAYLDRSISHKRARSTPQGRRVPEGFAYALGCRAAIYSDQGAYDRADADLAEALASVHATGHAVTSSILALHAMSALHRGAFSACLEWARKSREVAARVSSGYVFATGTAYAAYADYKLRRAPEALKALREAVHWLELREQGLFLSFAYACLADALEDAQEPQDARGFALKAIARAAQQDPLGEAMACRTLARLAYDGAEAGRSEALRWLAQARQSGERRRSAREAALTERVRRELFDGAFAAQGPHTGVRLRYANALESTQARPAAEEAPRDPSLRS